MGIFGHVVSFAGALYAAKTLTPGIPCHEPYDLIFFFGTGGFELDPDTTAKIFHSIIDTAAKIFRSNMNRFSLDVGAVVNTQALLYTYRATRYVHTKILLGVCDNLYQYMITTLCFRKSVAALCVETECYEVT